MTRIDVIHNQNILTIANGSIKKMISLPTVIKQFEAFDRVIVVRVHPKGINFLNENVFGISYEGEILWQIEKVDHVDKDSPYTGLSKKDELLTAYNWDGFDYLIDPNTGKVINKEFVK